MRPTNAATERFIHAENVILFRKRISETTTLAERLQLLKLLEEEAAKSRLSSKEN